MIDIQIENSRASFPNSVLGQVDDEILQFEVIDETMLHLHLSQSVVLISVQQYTFNGEQFDTAQEAVDHISNL